MRELHLFAGAGGGILGGMLLGHTCVCAVERDDYCRRVLRARQADKSLPEFPIYDDVRTFDGTPWKGHVDVVAGGFPCQPWSQAGRNRGAHDERDLWHEMARIVSEVRPRYVFAENTTLAAFEQPWRDLRGLGYRVPPALCVAASDVGAPHTRKRWWLLAELTDADSTSLRLDEQRHERTRGRLQDGGDVQPQHDGSAQSVARSSREQQHEDVARKRAEQLDRDELRDWWVTEPAVRRVVNGLAHRMDRLEALGNGQVPVVAATAWHYLIEQH